MPDQRDGQIGKCQHFDGDTDYVSGTGFTGHNADFTVELWFKTNTASSGYFFGRNDTVAGDWLRCQLRTGQPDLMLQRSDGTYQDRAETSDDYNDNAWHHVVVAWDQEEVYMYIDRDLVTNRGIYANGWRSDLPPDFSPARDSDGGLMIGSQIPYNYRFDGIIDNVMLYDRVLEESEVAEHYDALMP